MVNKRILLIEKCVNYIVVEVPNGDYHLDQALVMEWYDSPCSSQQHGPGSERFLCMAQSVSNSMKLVKRITTFPLPISIISNVYIYIFK